jgi:hypothetical protein
VVLDGIRTNSFQGGVQAGKRFERPDQLGHAGRFADVRPGSYLPAEHIKDNEADGIYGSALYPTEGLLLFRVPDSELLSAVFWAYNNWIAEFCRACRRRLKGIALIDVDDIPGDQGAGARAQAGVGGGHDHRLPGRGSLPDYESFWGAAQDLEMPLSLHIATNRLLPGIPPRDNRRSARLSWRMRITGCGSRSGI